MKITTSIGPNKFIEKKNHIEIIIISKKFGIKKVKLDKYDFFALKKYRWFFDKNMYAISHIKKTTMKMHRIIVGATQGQICDHINRNVLDNRLKNLRIVTSSESAFNTKTSSKNKTGIRGVSYDRKRKKYVVFFKHKFLGRFTSKSKAKKAYITRRNNYGK